VRILPFPDGVIDNEDRRHVAGFYRRIISVIYDIGISIDSLIKKLDSVKSISSDLLLLKNIFIDISSDLLIKKYNVIKSLTSDLLILIEITKSTTSDLLIFIQSIKSITSDLLIKKLSCIIYTTTDIIIERRILKESLYLKSYINIAEYDDSTINTSINKESGISKDISKFSETDSGISISRYSILDLIQEA